MKKLTEVAFSFSLAHTLVLYLYRLCPPEHTHRTTLLSINNYQCLPHPPIPDTHISDTLLYPLTPSAVFKPLR